METVEIPLNPHLNCKGDVARFPLYVKFVAHNAKFALPQGRVTQKVGGGGGKPPAAPVPMPRQPC